MQAQVHGITINYAIDGPEASPVVICSHCLAGDFTVWDAQITALRENFRILRFDTRGHGGSSAPDEAYSMEMLAKDAVGLLDSLNIGKAHFMGISMGGMIAQTLALMRPERILSLILCDTTASSPKEMQPVWDDRIRTVREKGMSALVDETLNRWLSREFQTKHPETARRIREMILKTPVPGYVGSCRAISHFDVKADLPKLGMPVLIMVGENDPGAPVQSARQIQAQIAGSELIVLPRAYHLSNIEAADEFNAGLLTFLHKHEKS